MSENDYIAEYVKENHPEILESLDFALWKMTRIVIKLRDDLVTAIKNIDFSELKKKVEEMNKSLSDKKP